MVANKPICIEWRSRYQLHNGRCYVDSVNVAVQLSDSPPDAGGFVVLPGSHKSNVGVPASGSAYQPGETTEPQGLVQPVMEAGDLLFCCGNAVTHGSRPWTAPHERRVVLSSFQSSNVDFSSQHYDGRERAFRHPRLVPTPKL